MFPFFFSVVNANSRPSMQEILDMEIVRKRMHLLPLHLQEYVSSPPPTGSKMIDTIKVPRNLLQLKDKLPVITPTQKQQFLLFPLFLCSPGFCLL
jgi:hypothetical protein